MIPLTEDCAHVRGLLPRYHDGDLLEPERAEVEQHLTSCAGCQESLSQLQGALCVLRDSLSAEDLVRLRADLPPPPLDPRPLAHLALLLAGLLLAALGLVALRALRAPAPVAPAASAQVAVALPAPVRVIPLPLVGGSVGLEEDPELLALPEAAPPAPIAPAPEPEPVAVAPPPREEEAAAAPPPPPAKADGPAAPPPPAAKALPPPAKLPDEARALLARIKVSNGLGYRGIILFFLRDPDGRERLSRAGPGLPQVREASPIDPAVLQVAPPRGEGRYALLMGELLDAPLGLRMALRDVGLDGRKTLEIGPVAFDPQRPRDAAPLLKGPVLLPGRARAALLREGTGGAVRELLAALRDPSLLELRRLRDELARVDPEARELDRRLRALLRDERGLRGLAITIGGQPRSLDLFGSSPELCEALPKLLRAALLEAALEREERTKEDIIGDPRATNLVTGQLATQDVWKPLLDALATATEESPGRFRSADGVVELNKLALVHAYAAPPP